MTRLFSAFAGVSTTTAAGASATARARRRTAPRPARRKGQARRRGTTGQGAPQRLRLQTPRQPNVLGAEGHRRRRDGSFRLAIKLVAPRLAADNSASSAYDDAERSKTNATSGSITLASGRPPLSGFVTVGPSSGAIRPPPRSGCYLSPAARRPQGAIRCGRIVLNSTRARPSFALSTSLRIDRLLKCA